jgi:Rod binding domain-containing protein
LWKSMQGSLDAEDDSADPAAGNIKDLQVQALCSGMANSGGIGIAKMITRHLDSQEAVGAAKQREQNQLDSSKGR